MHPTTLVRLVQTVLSALLASYTLLVAFTNLTDYGANFEFVRMVIGMSDTFSTSKTWRGITHPFAPHLFYAAVIAMESAAGVLGMLGAVRMWKTRYATPALFQKSKNIAVYGALAGLILWFGAFVVVGGEWFLMWQSKTWNAQATAFSLSIFYGWALSILLKNE